MKLHSLLSNPKAVLISHALVDDPVRGDDYRRVGWSVLNLVEGVVGREGTGSQRGRNRPAGPAIAGTYMVAVDSVASYLMGYDPGQLISLQVAAEVGWAPTT